MLIFGLGSNIGDRLSYLRQAVAALKDEYPVTSVSPVYEATALLPKGAPADWNRPFLNMAVGCDEKAVAASPDDILKIIKSIEQAIGRQDRGHWGPREIDIDILVYGDRQLASDRLTLPHAGLLERDFALMPLLDILPDWRHPAHPGLDTTNRFLRHSNTLSPFGSGIALE